MVRKLCYLHETECADAIWHNGVKRKEESYEIIRLFKNDSKLCGGVY